MMTDTLVIVDKKDSSDPYTFTAEGHLCKMDGKEDPGVHKHMIEKTQYRIGDEVYLISCREGYTGAYSMVWYVIYDTERLFSEVFDRRESILWAVGDAAKASISIRFSEVLDKKCIRYDEHFVNLD